MIEPLFVSKIVFALGMVMLGVLIGRKFNAVRAVARTNDAMDDESFNEFVSERLSGARRHISEAYRIVSRLALRITFASLHSMKLVSLKLESRTTRWLSRVHKASEKAMEEKAKKLVLEEAAHPMQHEKKNTVQGIKELKSEEFFSLLKDTPRHDKLNNKLSLIKEEKKEEQRLK